MSLKSLAAAAFAATIVFPVSLASAQDGGAFLGKLAGSWSGSGTVTVEAGAAPGQTSCRLRGNGSGASITISGSCDGAARGANLAVVLRWSEATGQFLGTFQGGAESGTANLTGKLSGDTLTMRVSSERSGAETMTLTLTGGDAATLRVGGKDPKSGKAIDYVRLGLRKA